MRNFGLILLFGGILGFLYCSTRLAGLEPVPPQAALSEYLRYEAGRFELGRYGSAFAAGLGALLSLFPRGR